MRRTINNHFASAAEAGQAQAVATPCVASLEDEAVRRSTPRRRSRPMRRSCGLICSTRMRRRSTSFANSASRWNTSTVSGGD
jgi:hypothetical protein